MLGWSPGQMASILDGPPGVCLFGLGEMLGAKLSISPTPVQLVVVVVGGGGGGWWWWWWWVVVVGGGWWVVVGGGGGGTGAGDTAAGAEGERRRVKRRQRPPKGRLVAKNRILRGRTADLPESAPEAIGLC